MVLDAPRETERPAGRSLSGNIRSRRRVGQQAAIDEAREGRVGARPLLENSTACRKSVPSNNPFVGFFGLIDIAICQVAVLSRYQIIYGEFDPGSGRTLAACLTHASRTRPLLREGVLVANG